MTLFDPDSAERINLVLSSELSQQLCNETSSSSEKSFDYKMLAVYSICMSLYLLFVILLYFPTCIFSRFFWRIICPCEAHTRVALLSAEDQTDQEREVSTKRLAAKRKRLEDNFSGVRLVS